jgi:hypothetical protein
MGKDEWSFEANLDRGCLPTGEPLEALYGVGWWTQEPEPEPPVTQCHICGGHAYDLGDKINCENCGIVEGI